MKSILVTFLLLVSIAQSFSAIAASSDFISTWKTTVSGESITLPLLEDGHYNFTVHWGDGRSDVITAWDQAEKTHVYREANTYTVTISGTLEGFAFDNRGDREKIRTINQWGNVKLSYDGYTRGSFFHGATYLDIIARDAPDLSNTTNLSNAFAWTGIDDSGNLNNWNTVNVTNMVNTFLGTASFNQPLSNWRTSNVTDMGGMFDAFGTGFSGGSFNQDIGHWDVSSVENMSYMFRSQTKFDRNLSRWNVSSVTRVTEIFAAARSFNNGGSADIADWDVSRVHTFQGAFANAANFNQPIGSWSLDSAENLIRMFNGSSFDQDIADWDISSVTKMDDMFRGSRITRNYDLLLIGWDKQTPKQTGVLFGCSHCQYTPGGQAEAARTRLIETYGWRIIDAGSIPSWDGGAGSPTISSAANWDNDLPLSHWSNIRFSRSSDAVTWDSPTTLNNIDLASGFRGTLSAQADRNLTVRERMTVEAGTLVTDATINTVEFDQKAGGALKLILDHEGGHGKINATGDVWLDGTLTVIGDGLTFEEGSRFDLLNWDRRYGTFDKVNLPALPFGWVWNISRLYSDGTVTAAISSDDSDGDSVLDAHDNCPMNRNSSQEDTDGDGKGNACDEDDDNDGYIDVNDAFPTDPFEWVDSDKDGVGDNADAKPNDPTETADSDGDGVGNNADNCPAVANPDQKNNDGDERGDICDPDDDNDGYIDVNDRFPTDASEWVDSDNDGVGDNADPFPTNPNERMDSDGDGVGDNSDNCTFVANHNQRDSDGDELGDACDADDDNDEYSDAVDPFPTDPTEWADSDKDGVGDNSDLFPNDPTETVDSDGDGVGDNSDLFPNDPSRSIDSDADGLVDSLDNCPKVENPDQSNNDGDAQGDACDVDDDNDGVRDEDDGVDGMFSRDHDNDGLDDSEDSDDDNDGIEDNVDGENGERRLDHDNDGTNDREDDDDDNDGIEDLSDARPLDTDNDELNNREDRDDDNDGITDILEGSGLIDSDGDGNPDSTDTDSDDDTVPDVVEAATILTDYDGDHKPDHFFDIDNDGLHDDITEAFMPQDSDHDGVPDYLDQDSDNDGELDGAGQTYAPEQAIKAVSSSGGTNDPILLSILFALAFVLKRRNTTLSKYSSDIMKL